jgi:hypothetical protein
VGALLVVYDPEVRPHSRGQRRALPARPALHDGDREADEDDGGDDDDGGMHIYKLTGILKGR